MSTDTTEATGIPFDPFELKDTVSGHVRDPFPMLRELRRECPVHLGPIDLGEGVDDPLIRTGPAGHRFRLRGDGADPWDNETYSSSVYEGMMGLVMGRTILQMDEPEHRIARALYVFELPFQVLTLG